MRHLLLLTILLVGCREASSAERTSRTKIFGIAQFRDTDTDDTGAHRDVAAPSGRGNLYLTVRGTGTLDADCDDVASGQFTASYDGALEIATNGEFTASIYPESLSTPSGCAIKRVDVGQIVDVQISAEMPSSIERCQELCASRGRAAADERCASAPDRPACRTPIGATIAQQCAATCVDRASTIWGHGWLDGVTLANVGGDDLASGNFGDVRVHLVFEQMLDTNRTLVAQ